MPGLVLCALGFWAVTFVQFKIEIPDWIPVNAVNFLKNNNIKGNIFCEFNWAQVSIRELSPSNKVFFDGRYETVYSDDFIKNYLEVIWGRKDYKQYLRQFPETDIMFLYKDWPLVQAVSEDKDWVKVYSSALAVIYLKDNGNNSQAIEDFRNSKLVYPQELPPFYFK
jgi:hypothetical protein